jgi:hypothetical protein
VRGLVAGLVACCVLASGSVAVARTEWVVLRVERVEVAVAHADGSPWDDDTPTGDTCGVLGGGDDLVASKTWGRIAKAMCPGSGGKDPTAPDLVLRFSVPDSAVYLSPLAADALAYDFRYDMLVPIEAISPQGLSIDVVDRDVGSASGDEHLGLVTVTPRDVELLLASRSRVKTYSDDSVTRLEISARRHRPSKHATAKLASNQRVVRAPVSTIAGEELTLRATRPRTGIVAVEGANLHRVEIDGCTRGVVQTSGGVAVGFEDGFAQVDEVGVVVSVKRPTLALWKAGAVGLPCNRKTSLASIVNVQTNAGSSLSSDAVRAIVQGRYLQGIQRCQERLLAADRTAHGRVRARFTVGPTGGVTKAEVKWFPAVEPCLQPLLLKWRFGAPKDADGMPTSEDVELTLRLGVL